jgi:hypothetical protein
MPLLNGRNLEGREVARFSEALRDASRNQPQLDMMLGEVAVHESRMTSVE